MVGLDGGGGWKCEMSETCQNCEETEMEWYMNQYEKRTIEGILCEGSGDVVRWHLFNMLGNHFKTGFTYLQVHTCFQSVQTLANGHVYGHCRQLSGVVQDAKSAVQSHQ